MRKMVNYESKSKSNNIYHFDCSCAYGKLGVPFFSSWHGYCTFYTFVGQPFPEGVVVHAKDTVLKQSH